MTLIHTLKKNPRRMIHTFEYGVQKMPVKVSPLPIHSPPPRNAASPWRGLKRGLALLAACGMALSPMVTMADDASVRASQSVLMSRNSEVRDRVRAAESLARFEPRAAVPILINALNETSEPVRRAAARGLWTVAQNDNAEAAAAARAAIPALRTALGDSSVSVAMNAAGALERIGEPAVTLAEARRAALRTPGPYSYERFLAARGLIGIDPPIGLTKYLTDWLFEEHERAGSANSSGARDNIGVANAALKRLVLSGDRGVLDVLERQLDSTHPAAPDLLRAMAGAKPLPNRFAGILVTQSDAQNADMVAAAYELMPALKEPAELALWVPAAARALSDDRRQAGAARALQNVAGKTVFGMTELARLAESNAPAEVRTIALATLAEASDATRSHPQAVLAAAKPAALQAFRATLARERPGAAFEQAIRALRFTERDFAKSAALYFEALKQNPDLGAQALLIDYIGQAHSQAGPLTEQLRSYAESNDAAVRKAAITALDAIRPSWREAGARASAVTAGSVPTPAPPRAGAKAADLMKFYTALRTGDRAAIARLVNAGNVNLPLVLPNGNATTTTPVGGAVQHCGLPQIAATRVAEAVLQLIAMGADPTQSEPDGSTPLDRAKAACPAEVQQALIGRAAGQ